jgi:hypothetical protein
MEGRAAALAREGVGWVEKAVRAAERHQVEVRRQAGAPAVEALEREGAVRVLSAVDFRHGDAAEGRHRGVGYEGRSNSGMVSGVDG